MAQSAAPRVNAAGKPRARGSERVRRALAEDNGARAIEPERSDTPPAGSCQREPARLARVEGAGLQPDELSADDQRNGDKGATGEVRDTHRAVDVGGARVVTESESECVVGVEGEPLREVAERLPCARVVAKSLSAGDGVLAQVGAYLCRRAALEWRPRLPAR